MKKLAIPSLLSLLFVMCFLSDVTAQVKEITADEYEKAVSAAKNLTYATFPKIVTSRFNSDPVNLNWRQTVQETSSRSFTETHTIDSNGAHIFRSITFDGKVIDQNKDGSWVARHGYSCSPISILVGEISVVYTLEETTESGKSFRLYVSTKKFANHKDIISKTKVDEAGRMVSDEFNGLQPYDNSYEYPSTVPAIILPPYESGALSLTLLQQQSAKPID